MNLQSGVQNALAKYLMGQGLQAAPQTQTNDVAEKRYRAGLTTPMKGYEATGQSIPGYSPVPQIGTIDPSGGVTIGHGQPQAPIVGALPPMPPSSWTPQPQQTPVPPSGGVPLPPMGMPGRTQGGGWRGGDIGPLRPRDRGPTR